MLDSALFKTVSRGMVQATTRRDLHGLRGSAVQRRKRHGCHCACWELPWQYRPANPLRTSMLRLALGLLNLLRAMLVLPFIILFP